MIAWAIDTDGVAAAHPSRAAMLRTRAKDNLDMSSLHGEG
jgi:hypothetical protein